MPRLGRPVIVIELSAGEKEELEGVVRRRRAAKADVQRAKVVLLSAQGVSGKEIARRVGLSEPTVGKWRQRFLNHRCLGLSEMPRSGAPRRVSDEQIEEIIRQTLESTPAEATHWSTREMAKRCGFSRQTVSRIWRTFGLQPHRSENFTLSNDPYFVDKVRDVVGLYLDPPANALVLCVDEKTQIQALERSQPVLPMRPGQPERRTHDYYRHGTLSLFAALEVATGRVISSTKPKHRSTEFLSFLRQVEKEVPAGLKSTPFSITTPRTKPPLWKVGCASTPVGICTSSRLTQAGSIRRNASLLKSPTSASAAVSFAVSENYSKLSKLTSPNTINRQSPFVGLPAPILSSERSLLYVKYLRDATLDTVSADKTPLRSADCVKSLRPTSEFGFNCSRQEKPRPPSFVREGKAGFGTSLSDSLRKPADWWREVEEDCRLQGRLLREDAGDASA